MPESLFNNGISGEVLGLPCISVASEGAGNWVTKVCHMNPPGNITEPPVKTLDIKVLWVSFIGKTICCDKSFPWEVSPNLYDSTVFHLFYTWIFICICSLLKKKNITMNITAFLSSASPSGESLNLRMALGPPTHLHRAELQEERKGCLFPFSFSHATSKSCSILRLEIMCSLMQKH